MLYTVFISKSWGNKKESGAFPFKKGMMPASPLSLFLLDIYLIWEFAMGVR